MTALFRRFVSFEVGKPGEEGFRFTDLKIEFDITKTSTSTPNPGRVSVYNLSKATRDVLSDEGLVYVLRVGYSGLNNEPLVKILSQGDVLDIFTQRKQTDVVTTFKIGEGTKKLGETTLDKSFAEGISTKQIINQMAGALDIAVGAVVGLKDVVFNSGYSATGKVKDRLDELTKKQGLEWSVQNNELQILPEKGATSEEAVLLTKDSGLLKAFREKTAKAGKVSLSDITKFTCLLNPDIKVGRKIAIYSELDEIGESVESPAFFTVRKAKFSGDNKTGKFTCQGEAT